MNSRQTGNGSMQLMWLIFLLYSAFFCGCKSQTKKIPQTAKETMEASLQAVGTKAERENIRNIIFLADCVSPRGSYTTEIHTAAGGYTYFKQRYSYKPAAFEAVVYNRISGVEAGDPVKQLGRDAIYTIRGHEFVNMILEVDERFHGFHDPEIVTADGIQLYRVKAKDELDHPCYLFFDGRTNLFTALQFQNPVHEKEIISIKFAGWKKVQKLQLPHHVEITQGDKVFTFAVTKIIFNDPGFQKKHLNEKQ